MRCALENKPASEITAEDMATAVARLARDGRVVGVKHVGANLLDVEIRDTREGDLVGVYSVGRVISAMKNTHAGWVAQSAEDRRLREALAEQERKRREERNARFLRNTEWLAERGVKLDDLYRIREKLIGGVFLTEREIKKLSLYTSSFCGGRGNLKIESILAEVEPMVEAA